MKKNEIVEKKIIASLEKSDEKLNPSVLDAAKSELRIRKLQKNRVVYGFALATCAIVVICLAIVLPLTLGGMKEVQYSSMYDYFKAKNININTYDHLLDNSFDPADGAPIKESPYEAKECILVRSNGKDIYIRQKYDFAETDILTVSVLLVDDKSVRQKVFGDYMNLEKHARFAKVDINYAFNAESKTGKATFVYNDRNFYIEISCGSESALLSHVQALIISQ